MSQRVQELSKSLDIKEAILEAVGTAVEQYTLFDDDVLLATYIRPEKTKGGIIMPERVKDEDRFQGKAGLLLKCGPTAFRYDRSGMYNFEGDAPKLHDWVVYRPSDGWEIALNGVSCRIIRASMLRGAVEDPSVIW